MVFNQRLTKSDAEMYGVIRVCRLYDLEKDPKRDNLQKTFFPVIQQVLTGESKSESRNLSKRTTGAEGKGGNMPRVVSFALSQDESKMNLYLKDGEIICFDESRT